MRVIVILSLLAVALMGSHAAQAADDFADSDVLARWITYYYLEPKPDQVADAIHAASSKGFIREGKKAPSFFGFVAGVISNNHSMAEAIAEGLTSLPEVDQQVLILGVWYSTYEDGKPLLERLSKSMPNSGAVIDQLLASGRPSLLELPLEQGPWVLDALWGNFMATGDDAPVIKIISALPWINVRGDTSRLMVGGAARWSLISNAIQHERVLAICRDALMSQPEEVAEVLREVIAEAERDMKEGKTG